VTAEAEGCDYITFGTVFTSAGKPSGHPVAGIAALREVCAGVRIPVLAIGGMTVERAATVSAAGAAGLAAIGLFSDLDGLTERVEALRRAFDTRSRLV
jgi:thiamine monophosphate synthase